MLSLPSNEPAFSSRVPSAFSKPSRTTLSSARNRATWLSSSVAGSRSARYSSAAAAFGRVRTFMVVVLLFEEGGSGGRQIGLGGEAVGLGAGPGGSLLGDLGARGFLLA